MNETVASCYWSAAAVPGMLWRCRVLKNLFTMQLSTAHLHVFVSRGYRRGPETLAFGCAHDQLL